MTAIIRATVTDSRDVVVTSDLSVSIPTESRFSGVMFGMVAGSNAVGGLRMIDGVITVGSGPDIAGNVDNNGLPFFQRYDMAYLPTIGRYFATGYRDPSLSQGRMAYSDDEGITWVDTGMTLASGNSSMVLHRPSDNRVLAGNIFGRFRHTDDGSTWTAESVSSTSRINPGIIRASDDQFLVSQDSRTLRFGNSRTEMISGGIVVSIFQSTTQYFLSNIVAVPEIPGRLVLHQRSDGSARPSTMAYSDDYGETWQLSPTVLVNGDSFYSFAYGNGLIVGVGRLADNIFLYPQIIISSDGGVNWVKQEFSELFSEYAGGNLTNVAFYNGVWAMVGYTGINNSAAAWQAVIVTTTDFQSYQVIDVPEFRFIAGLMARQTP